MALVLPHGLSIKIPSDAIGNRTRNLPACSVVPQPTAPPGAPVNVVMIKNEGKLLK
jgi:hypothetical protein